MEESRHRELRIALEEEFSSQPMERPSERLQWIARRLEEYVDRWIGFYDLGTVGMPALVQSSFFGMIEIGAELFNRELRHAGSQKMVRAAWAAFTDALGTIKSELDEDQARRLPALLRKVQADLLASESTRP